MQERLPSDSSEQAVPLHVPFM